MVSTEAQIADMSYVGIVWRSIASIGWYLLAISCFLWYISPFLKEKYLKWKESREEEEYAAKYHKNPDLLQERLSALEASRQKMQQKYSAESAIARQCDEDRKQRKAETLRMLKQRSPSGGERLGVATSSGSNQGESLDTNGTKPKSLKPEYNPLMGDGARGYRPPKRTCCRKGGCG